MNILEIAKKINQNGGNLYLVGGAVRDKLLGKEIHDEDYCVTGISTKKFEELFPKAHLHGKFFAVYELEGKEFAMARKEEKNGIGHKSFNIEANENINIEEDLKRRDITINSIAEEVLTGKIIDPFDGRKDLEKKLIKAISSAFKEDPLRVYRVARFAAKMDFDVDTNTIKQMENLKNELNTLPKERIFEEFKKALDTQKPSKFFEILKQANVLEVHFKEIYDLIGSIQPQLYHPEGDSYNHTMIVLDKSTVLTQNLEIRFSALVHDLGKGITPIEERPHHYNHEKNGVVLVQSLGERIGVPQSWIKCGITSSLEHMKGGIFNKMTPPKQVDFITRVNKSILGLDGLKVVVTCDRWRDDEKPQDIKFDIIGKELFEKVNGNDIKKKYNVKDEKQIGELLRNERIELIKTIENRNKLI